MKLNNKIVLISLCSMFLISCDPPHYIDFVNNSTSNAKVKLNLNSKMKNYDLDEIAIGDSIIFNLKQKDTANIDFGIGTWSDNQIKEVVNSIKSIEIETEDVKTVYKTEKSMKNILEKNREGFIFKTKIEIEIKQKTQRQYLANKTRRL